MKDKRIRFITIELALIMIIASVLSACIYRADSALAPNVEKKTADDKIKELKSSSRKDVAGDAFYIAVWHIRQSLKSHHDFVILDYETLFTDEKPKKKKPFIQVRVIYTFKDSLENKIVEKKFVNFDNNLNFLGAGRIRF